VHQVASPNSQPGHEQNPPLERQIVQMNILQGRSRLDFKEVPRILWRWPEDIHAAITTFGGECRLEQWLAQFQRMADEHFRTLLRAESLTTIPQSIWSRLDHALLEAL